MAIKRLMLNTGREDKSSIINISDWSTDLSGSTAYITEWKNGATASNTRESTTGPYGESVYAWKTDKGTTVSGNWGAGMQGPWLAIDNKKTYRFSCWVKRVYANTNDAKFYFGLYASDTVTLMNVKIVTSGASSTNQYFISTYSDTGSTTAVFPTGEWRLMSYIVRPYGYSGTTNHPNTGVWKPDGTFVGVANGDMQFDNSSITHVQFRMYAPYEAAYTITPNWYIAYPRIDLVDGTEPSLPELLGNYRITPFLNQINNSLVSTADWSTDLSGSTNDFNEYRLGTYPLNQRISDTGPYGDTVYVWQGGQTGQVSAVSGFNGGNSAGDLTKLKAIDNTKTYRFTMWARVKTAMSTGACYIGMRAFNSSNAIEKITDISSGAATNNPYFGLSLNADSSTLFPTGEWRLVCGYLHPYTYSGTTDQSTTGILKPDGTNLGLGGANGDLKSSSATTQVLIRFFGPYTETGNGLFQVYDPRIDLVDGTEPSITALLTGAKQINLSVQGEQEFIYTDPGDYTLTIPSGSDNLVIECWGAGGNGGNSSRQYCGGGGGGAYSKVTIATPTAGTLDITVGQGSKSLNNGDSSVEQSATVLCLAQGGSAVPSNTVSGAAGGSSSIGVGDVKYSGGNGANGQSATFYAGGGGEGACTTLNGNNGVANTGQGGSGCDGGDGGNGGYGDADGSSGNSPGGGGGGSIKGGSTARYGGTGGNGKVRVTYFG